MVEPSLPRRRRRDAEEWVTRAVAVALRGSSRLLPILDRMFQKVRKAPAGAEAFLTLERVTRAVAVALRGSRRLLPILDRMFQKR
jgi:hypothetical protein